MWLSRRVSGAATWLLGAAALLAVAVQSCTSFQDIKTRGDGGAPNEGDDVGDAFSDDTAVEGEAGTGFCTVSSAELCLDMDDGQLSDERLHKLVRGAGIAQVTNEQSFSPTFSFLSALPVQPVDAGAEIAQIVYRPARDGSGIVCEAEIFVGEASDSSVVAFALQPSKESVVGLAFRSVGGAASASIQVSHIAVDGGAGDAGAPETIALGGLAMNAWVHLRFAHLYKGETQVALGASKQNATSAVGTAQDPSVTIGASATGAAGWRLFFDNIACSTLP